MNLDVKNLVRSIGWYQKNLKFLVVLEKKILNPNFNEYSRKCGKDLNSLWTTVKSAKFFNHKMKTKFSYYTALGKPKCMYAVKTSVSIRLPKIERKKT